jgi:hypothetical protein
MEHTQVRSVPYCFRPFFSSFSYYNTKGFNLACARAPLSLKENHRKDEEEEEEEEEGRKGRDFSRNEKVLLWME